MPDPNQPVSHQDHIASILASLPGLPGIYQMLDASGNILYVGKAKSLKKRVASYFIKNHEYPKTRLLVSKIRDIEVILTRSETEALLLEQNLIKTHTPPYNVTLRDDKSYLYIYVTGDKYPRIAVGRGKGKHQKGRFFGPFPSANSARETLEILQKLFQVRQCTNSYFASRQRPCLQYQIKRCKAPCVGLVPDETYKQDVDSTLKFLSGDSRDLDKKLQIKMHEAADALQFEKAASLRNQLTLLKEIQSRQAIYSLGGEADIIAFGREAGVICVHVLNVRGGRVLGGKNFFPDLDPDLDQAELLSNFVAYFYFQVADDLPKEIITSLPLEDASAMSDALLERFERRVQIKSRVRDLRAEWLDIARINVENALTQRLADHRELHTRFDALSSELGRPLDRIECFDISHTGGESTTASCVVFDIGGARKRDYRQYDILEAAAGDDYAAMREVIRRRYTKHDLPDLLLIDGGKGQLNQALQVLEEIGKNGFVVGVSKGEGRKGGLETLHFADGSKKLLGIDSKALHLIMQVRDEAHRFAITKHRAKRDKKRGSSVLEVIPGLGKKRRRDLLNHFGGIQGVLKASERDIAQVDGIGLVIAKTIYKSLHN